ncbi:MAG: hypothetical protein COW08_02500 [Ignavibacteriales bacterium CG12_big_fil_rev_8_21_14_0_65_30_8]|nr:MAG: hypothetical protein COW08_02500 [Ignavibacteriales bacterium CG12_big_fil_rev_8_21_14_0_65_30_8]
MINENELKFRILNSADELFLKYGFKKVTMDEIAQDLGISKKTIYKYFSSKKDLVLSILELKKQEVNNYLTNLIKDTELDFISKLKRLMNFIGTVTVRLTSPVASDIQKNFPEVWNDLMKHRKQNTLRVFTSLINEGIKENVFRDDIDKELVVLIYVNTMQQMLNPDTLVKIPFTAPQVFDAAITIMFEGIMTEEGRNKFCTLNKKRKNEEDI